MWNYFLKLYIFVIPLYFINGYYEPAKNLFFISCTLVLTLLILFFSYNDIAKIKLDKSDYFFLLFMIVSNVSTFFALSPSMSFFGGGSKNQGLIFFISLFLFQIFLKLLDKKGKYYLIKIVVIGLFIQIIIIFFQKFILEFNLYYPVGTFGERISVSFYLIICLGFIELIFKNKNLYLKYFCIILLTITIFMLGKKAAIISFVSYFSIYYLLAIDLNFKKIISVFLKTGVRRNCSLGKRKELFIDAKRNMPKYYHISLIIFFFLIFVFVPASIGSRYKSIFFKRYSVFEDRSILWKSSIIAIAHKPLFGYGFESQTYIFDEYYSKKGIYLNSIKFDRSHNLFLDILINTGIIGFILFMSWLYCSMDDLYKKKKYVQISGVFSFLIFSFIQPVGVVPWVFLLLLLKI